MYSVVCCLMSDVVSAVSDVSAVWLFPFLSLSSGISSHVVHVHIAYFTLILLDWQGIPLLRPSVIIRLFG
jgi:hypothetical protein